MPKLSTSARPQDGKKIKKSKHNNHQYRDAARARKHRKTRIKGVVEEVVEPVEPGKARPLTRTPKYDLAKIERMLRANCEDSQPVETPTVPAEVYAPNAVNFNVPRVIVPTSEATTKRKQTAAADDDGDTTDVDDSEDVVVVPAGFVEVAENLGLLSTPAASSTPREDLEEPLSAPHAQPDEKPLLRERLSTKIETASDEKATSETIASSHSSSSSNQPSHVVPASVLVENNSQTTAAISATPYLESSESSAAILVPQDASVPESFQESSASQSSWNDNMYHAQEFHFHRQEDAQNAFYPGSTDDVNMEFSGAATMELPAYSLPTMWTSPQPQPEHQTFYPLVSQVADNNSYRTYTMDSIHPTSWASMQFQPMQNGSVQQSTQINQLPFNHVVDPFIAASCFWTALSGSPDTSQSPTPVPEIIKSTPTQDNEQRPLEEPRKYSGFHKPIRQESYPGLRRCRPVIDEGFHPFPNLRRCKNMKLINMSEKLEESHIIRPKPVYRRLKKPPTESEMDKVNCLRAEVEGHTAPQMSKVEHGKRRREDSPPDLAHPSNPDLELPPRQRRRCEPDASRPKTPIPEKRNHKIHRRRTASLSRTPTESWDFSKFCPSISSLADRVFKFFYP